MKYKEQNIEYRILNVEFKIPNSVFSIFSTHSTFYIPHSTQRGFTLMETLVAISILLIAVVGPMSTIGGSLSSIFIARDQMIAINFAQEGIEVVRQVRDSNMLDKWGGGSAVWGDGLTIGNYIKDPTVANSLVLCGENCTTDQKLIRQDTTTGLFYQTTTASSGENTQFSRIVKVDDVSPFEKTITSAVTWSVGGVIKKVEVKESIFGINS